VGVYLALSALDFPFCFIAVRWIGTEKIGEWEHKIVEWFKRASPIQIPEKYQFWKKQKDNSEADDLPKLYDHGVKEAEVANSGEGASMWCFLKNFSKPTNET
jgi:N-terminal acetyltransferase 2